MAQHLEVVLSALGACGVTLGSLPMPLDRKKRVKNGSSDRKSSELRRRMENQWLFGAFSLALANVSHKLAVYLFRRSSAVVSVAGVSQHGRFAINRRAVPSTGS